MSVLSAKTAVTWAKPLRENERVNSRPGVPASVVSIGNVTCFSISTGESDGARALIWTWTLVTSGTASIGSLVRDHAPDSAAASVTSRTNHRRRTEAARTYSIIPSVLGGRLEELCLEQKRVGDRNGLAGFQTRQHLSQAVVAPADHHRALFE